jgi:hypothetical protein
MLTQFLRFHGEETLIFVARSNPAHHGNKTFRNSDANYRPNKRVKHLAVTGDKKFVASTCLPHWFRWRPEEPEVMTSKVKLPPDAYPSIAKGL